MTECGSKIHELIGYIKGFQRAIIAYSGGVDSTLLLKAALDALGIQNILAVTVASPLMPEAHIEAARVQAEKMGVPHRIIPGQQLSEENIINNPIDRCYHCKKNLFHQLIQLALAEDYDVIFEGCSQSDLEDYRPGLNALKEMPMVQSPLMACGLDKNGIRQLARFLGLDNWDKPSEACLASRIPYGQIITPEKLAAIEKAEATLQSLGFTQVRVRHHGDIARIEAAAEDIIRFADPLLRSDVSHSIKECGFKYVALDIDGYRTGSLNEVI